MTAVISLNHVGMEFPAVDGLGTVKALDDVSLEVHENESVVALGASGCSKTTLLNVIAGFLSPTSGEVLHKVTPVAGPGRDRRVVFQEHALLPWLNVVENTEFGLKPQGVSSDERRSKARENMQELILEVWKMTRKVVFIITHSVEEALFMAIRLIVMLPRPGRTAHIHDLKSVTGHPCDRSRAGVTTRRH